MESKTDQTTLGTGTKDLLSYLQKLGIFSEDDTKEFLKIVDEDLPKTFRINSLRQNKERLVKELMGLSAEIEAAKGFPAIKESKLITGVYQLTFDIHKLRKDPEVKRLHTWLLSETNNSNILRQELVSMIPVEMLKIEPQHAVLDMCAAPGSKTVQIIEKLNAKASNGFVVANEMDSMRANMLAYQTLKLNVHNIVVINNDGTKIPENFSFDRVLCDVPCSGDGTIRKNDAIKKGWTPKYGLKLHGVQLNLLLKGLNLLKEDSYVLYSTCSMNPIEDEAVYQEFFRRMFDKSVELVDIKPFFKDFKICEGISDWNVYCKHRKKDDPANWLSNYEEALKFKLTDRVHKTMFCDRDAISKHHLERSVRILPHHNNTGGFYLALLHKKTQAKVELEADVDTKDSEKETKTSEADEEKKAETEIHKEKADEIEQISASELSKFVTKHPAEWEKIESFYGLDKSFPKDCLYVLGGSKKRIVYIEEPVAKYLEALRSEESPIRISFAGLKLFERIRDNECVVPYRICFEGLDRFCGFFTKQVLEFQKDTFVKFMDAFPAPIQKLEELANTDKLKDLVYGPVIVRCRDFKQPLSFIFWKGVKNCNLLIGKEEQKYIHRCIYLSE